MEKQWWEERTKKCKHCGYTRKAMDKHWKNKSSGNLVDK